MVQIHCCVSQGLKASARERLAGLTNIQDATAVHLCLTSPDVASTFALIVRELGETRPSRLLLPYDRAEVRERLRKADAAATEEGEWICVDAGGLSLPALTRALEAVSFTALYGQVGGTQDIPKTPALLLASLREAHFVAVFEFYDESLQILSTVLSGDAILDAVRRVAMARGLEVACQ